MHQMHIVSINVGKEETISLDSKSATTGICKEPVATSVAVTTEGVSGDTVCNTEHHGGRDQAVYAYSFDDYEWWEEQLGSEIPPGTFGDNLTIRGMPTDMNVGDRLLIGDVVLEATAPRIPCNVFAMRMQDKSFGMKFRRAERPGIYFRVLNEGEVSAGDAVTLVEDDTGTVTISDLVRFYYDLSPKRAELERLLQAPVAKRFRAKIEKKLAAIAD
jgi:MOSC domain-containing protein YiiM